MMIEIFFIRQSVSYAEANAVLFNVMEAKSKLVTGDNTFLRLSLTLNSAKGSSINDVTEFWTLFAPLPPHRNAFY